MKLPKACKIELVTSQDASRVPITELYLDQTGGKSVLVATNGKALCYLPVDDAAADPAGFVSAAVLKTARKASKGNDAHAVLTEGTASFDDQATTPRASSTVAECKYPNWRQVIPDEGRTHSIRIGLDAKLLWQLAQAMGTQAVQICIVDSEKPFVILPQNGGQYNRDCPPYACEGARGVLMPIKLPE